MNFQFVSYIDEVLPEIILLGLLNDAHGYKRGADLSFKLREASSQSCEHSAPIVSDLARFSRDEIQQTIEALATAGALEPVREALTPFILLCPAHPLAGLGPAEMGRDVAMGHLKGCVGRLYDRYSTPACAAMANLYYVQACAGRLHIAQGMRVPDLDAIITRPDSDDALHASASVRMYAQSLVGRMREEQATDWPDTFWNNCYQFSECDLTAEEAGE